MSLITSTRRYLADTGRAFDRAPVECALTVLGAGLLSWALEDNDIGSEVVHVGVALLLAIAAAWSATLLNAMGRITDARRQAVTLAGAAAAMIYLVLSRDFDRGSEAWRAFMLLASAVLLVFAAPSFTGDAGDADLRLRRINSRFVLRAIGIALYGLALFGGLAVAIAAVDNLFELDLNERLYGHVFIWIMVVLVPWVVIGGLDDYVRPLEEQSDLARMIYRLVSYLVPPLVALYFIILCLYVVRIGITGELPKNLVSPMVIAAGLLSALALIIFDPRADTGHGLRWLRWTPFVFLPLVPLGIWALAARVDDYGWTEFRILRVVVLLVLCALAIAAAVRVVRRKPLALRVIPIALGVVLLLGAVGPWSVLSAARRSQQARLRAALVAANVDSAKPLAAADTANRTISGDVYRDLHGAAAYLQSNYGGEAVREVVPTLPEGLDGYRLADYYHLVPDDRGIDRLNPVLFGNLPPNRLFSSPSGQIYRVSVADYTGKRVVPPNEPVMRGQVLEVPLGTDTMRVDLRELIAGMNGGDRQGNLPPDRVALTATDAAGTNRGTLIILELTVNVEKTPRITRLDALLTMPD